ncbi:unnamed protein product [Spirodela intermedia]|uniref:Uncharacterized protein n=1 Tax=Spirodela intermedia TaxID=51605 RepID=A0A7I8ID70_SPIIN|nr:unnamed protein product [Spirodela intermedia]CAA6654791.1 unnamed protein product [Spirodela intermedia]
MHSCHCYAIELQLTTLSTNLLLSCKLSSGKLASFRIKELKDVLSQLGVAKQGKKQDLIERILRLLSDEQVSKSQNWGKRNSIGKDAVAKIIDEIYRKMQVPGSTDSASRSQSGSDLNYVKPKEELDDSKLDIKIRCLCGSSLASESMIKCEDPRCHVWQHISCVIIPEKGLDGVQPYIPSRFYCEVCRLNRADPFWVTVAHPLLPVKLSSAGPGPDGTNSAQQLERMFQLSRADRDLLQKNEYDLQVWCILLNDKVPFRMQWPQFPDLVVNGIPVRATNRPGGQLLGANGRDDGPVITTCSREGINKISFTRCDARTFCFGLRIAKRRTLQQVLSLIPKETDGERFADSLARVCRCIGGGATTDNADSDSDLEVVAELVTVSLRCPMSGSRMRIAGRFKPCVHMGCFDLETFVELNQRSRKWQCPICLKNYSLENIIIDPYFNRITSLLRNCDEEINEIEVKPDGSWRAKGDSENRTLGQWHLPDGTQVFTNSEVKPDSELLQQSKQESTGGLKLGIKRNPNGIWEVSKPSGTTPSSSGNHAAERFEGQCQKPMPLSVSATGSYGDGEDVSVNQEGRRNFDFSSNVPELLDPVSFSIYGAGDRVSPVQSKDADVIVLSDSEEDNNTTLAAAAYDTGPPSGNGIPFTETDPGAQDSYLVDTGPGSACLGLFGSGDDFEMPLWPLPTCSQTGSGFQLFNTDASVSDTMVDVNRNSLGCPPMNGFGLGSDGMIGTVPRAEDFPIRHSNEYARHNHHHESLHQSRMDSSASQSNADANGSLVNNPLAFAGGDPSLQIFLPAQPAGILQPDLTQGVDMVNAIPTDDWISLRLGGNDGNHIEPAATSVLNSRHQFGSDGRMDSLANTASLLLSMNDDRGSSNNQRSDTLFSQPQQPRAVRPRLYLSIDSD